MDIYDLISRARKLREETQIDSVSPELVGGLHEDTLKYINEYQLLASSPALHKVYVSVSAMQSDGSPKSDLTGRALKPGQLVVIVPSSQTDTTAGDVYRYDGPSGNTSAWTFVSKIGASMLVTQEDIEGLQGQLDSNKQSIKELGLNKANTSGYYPELSVGQADNLPDRGDVVEAEIGFRASAGADNSIEDSVANVQELLGQSVVWNQLASNEVFQFQQCAGTYSDGIYTVTFDDSGYYPGIYAPAIPLAVGHKLLCQVNVKSDMSIVVGVNYRGTNASTYSYDDNSFHTLSLLMDTVSGNGNSLIIFSKGDVGTFQLSAPKVYDLTLMFGSGNEPTTIEEFEAFKNQLVGVDTNAYNEGEVLGVNAVGFKSVNDNAWDEEWERGQISSNTGELIESNQVLRPKNYIKVLPNEQYCINVPFSEWIIFYDADKNFVSRVWQGSQKVFTTPSNCAYLLFRFPNTYGTTYNHDICIRLAHSGYKTDYIAHEESRATFDLSSYFPDGMHGINGVRDSATREKATRRIGVVDLGSLAWNYTNTSGQECFVSYGLQSQITKPLPSEIGNILTAKYVSIYFNAMWDNNYDKTICIHEGGAIAIKDLAYTDAATFKEAMNGVMLYYELATPIETKIDPQLNFNYKVWDFGTEEMLADKPSMPVIARIIYGFNATDTIRGNKAKNEVQDERLNDIEKTMVQKDDYAPNLSVGLADNLTGDELVESEFLLRQSGGGAIDDGTARMESIKGNSVVWNQRIDASHLVKNVTTGNTVTQLSNGYVRAEVAQGTTAGGVTISNTWAGIIVGHKYAAQVDLVTSAGLTLYMLGLTKSNIGESTKFIVEATNTIIYLVAPNSATAEQSISFDTRILLTDLTLMFGAGNEPTTIEDFYARIPQNVDINAYNEGEVIHMNADAVKSIGRNLWDEEWELGTLGTVGEPIASDAQIRSKNFNPCLPNTTYYLLDGTQKNMLITFWYDANKNFIERSYIRNGLYTTPTNAAYFKVRIDGHATYNHDVCINLSDPDFNGQYEPHISREQSLDIVAKYFPEGMKSAGSAYDEIRYDGIRQKWEKVQRIGSVDLGTLSWMLHASGHFYSADLNTNAPLKTPKYNEVCFITSRYAISGASNIEDETKLDKTAWAESGHATVVVRDDAYTDAATFKEAMSGVMLYYELAEPVIEEIDFDGNLDYEVWNGGMEEAIADTPSTPLKADIKYGFNATGAIKDLKKKVAELEELIAQLQATISSLTSISQVTDDEQI